MKTAIAFCCAGGFRMSSPASAKRSGDCSGASHENRLRFISSGSTHRSRDDWWCRPRDRHPRDLDGCGAEARYCHGQKKRINVCGAGRSSRQGASTEEPVRRRSSSHGCGRKTLSTTLRRVSWRKSGRHEKRPKFTARRGEAGNTWRALLGTHKWGGPPGHAGVVEVAGTAALADCCVPALVEAGIPGLALGERRAVIPQRPQLTSPAKLILV